MNFRKSTLVQKVQSLGVHGPLIPKSFDCIRPHLVYSASLLTNAILLLKRSKTKLTFFRQRDPSIDWFSTIKCICLNSIWKALHFEDNWGIKQTFFWTFFLSLDGILIEPIRCFVNFFGWNIANNQWSGLICTRVQ